MTDKQMYQLVIVAMLVFLGMWVILWANFRSLDYQLDYINQRIGNPYK